MFKYIIKRVFMGAVTLLVLITVTFFLTRLMPGNPFEGENVSDAALEHLTAQYKLDRPVWEQYLNYMNMLLHGDFGVSYKKPGTTVMELIMAGAPATMRLGLITYFIALVLGIVIGIWESTTKRELVRGALMSFSTLGVSMPNFVLAILLLLIFGVKLGWFPILGLGSFEKEGLGVIRHYVLPVTTLAVYPVASISRMVHSSFTEAMHMDYVTMAKAKGLSRRTIQFKHILKNALIPVVTNAGPTVAFLMTGSFVVESLFTINGIGREFVNSVSGRDYTVIMGLTIFMGELIIAFNLIADLLCPLVDPRVKLS